MYNCICSDPECRTHGCKLSMAHTNSYTITTPPPYHAVPVGCICPPTSEQTCQNECCPRKSKGHSPWPIEEENTMDEDMYEGVFKQPLVIDGIPTVELLMGQLYQEIGRLKWDRKDILKVIQLLDYLSACKYDPDFRIK